MQASNPHLDLTLHVTEDNKPLFTVRDKRTDRLWEQTPATNVVVIDSKQTPHGFDLSLQVDSICDVIFARIRLHPSKPELGVTIEGEGAMPSNIGFPAPFLSCKGDLLILPVSEGMSYPVDDANVKPHTYHDLTAGKDLSMPWTGIMEPQGAGMMMAVETINDAWLWVPRRKGLLAIGPGWRSEKGQFGYARRVGYAFFSEGGYVAMCGRYRAFAEEQGLVKTLREKREENPNVDPLVGAANLWWMDGWKADPVELCREMQKLGMERILFSDQRSRYDTRAMNEMGILTGRIDSYHDSMDPAIVASSFDHPNQNWVQEAWPNGLVIGADGEHKAGFPYRDRDGRLRIPGWVCDIPAPGYAQKRIQEDQSHHPRTARFLDTTACDEWNECYHDDHPMTRTDSRNWRMELLRRVNAEGLIVGTEQGHVAALHHAHYFEGMMSLFPYRVDPHTDHRGQMIDEVPDYIERFQVGHEWRLPLWELCFHDCVVSTWYWHDYSNKFPRVWRKRDLWNALYGTVPMYLFTKIAAWERCKQSVARSYQTATLVARATGYEQMTSHEWLTDDHSAQRTEFANGVAVTVDFDNLTHKVEGAR